MSDPRQVLDRLVPVHAASVAAVAARAGLHVAPGPRRLVPPPDRISVHLTAQTRRQAVEELAISGWTSTTRRVSTDDRR